MYHRARAGRHGNPPEVIAAHFAHIASTYRNVLPGDPLAPGRLSVCLSFDDGYFDFYATVFPLLKKYQLRAVLAVPVAVVRERVDAASDDRLNLESREAFAYPSRGGFCTWAELAEMAGSGHVTIAAHGFTHGRLDSPTANLAMELDAPKTILKTRVAQPIDSFVFPFGRCSQRSLQRARAQYRYVFRIGGALNRGWGSRLLYRVDADAMPGPRSLFSPARLVGYRARYFWNRLRMR